MSNLIIGNTSQLSYYFPEEFDKISSRNLNYKEINSKKHESIFLLFAEQRTFLNEGENFFNEVNVNYTIEVIDKLKDFCNKIVIYSTSELWNNIEGGIRVTDNFNYNYTPYIKSKEIISNYINEHRDRYQNVQIIYPFNFNSPYRKNGFLFSKIFESLIHKKTNNLGNIDFLRDIIHPSIIVKESLINNNDLLLGSGELFNVESFVKDLFSNLNLKFNDYIFYDNSSNLTNQRKNYYSEIKYSNYNELLNLTLNDIKKYSFS
jgi:GDP-D-mannose dehydratase